MKVVIIVALGMGLGWVSLACGNGNEQGGEQPTATFVDSDDFTQDEARVAAERALLRLDDFPTGWTERPADDDSDSELQLDPPCEDRDYAGQVARVGSPEFHGPDDEEVSSEVIVYADEAGAREAVAGADSYLDECGEIVAEALGNSLRESLEEDAPVESFEVEVNVERLSFPPFGDESLARRFSVTVSSGELPFDYDFYFDLIGMRVGSLISEFSYLSLLSRPDSDMQEELMGAIEGRLSSADSELSGEVVPEDGRSSHPERTATAVTRDVGTRENPVPLGDSWEVGDWSIRVISTTPSATDIVLQENQFNDPPAADRQFFIVRLEATRIGAGSGSVGSDLSIEAVDDANVAYTTFGQDSSCGSIPDDLDFGAEAFEGGTIEGNACWSVRSDQVGSLVMYVENFFSFDDERVFFALW